MFNLSIFSERLSELMFDNNINAPKLAEILGIHRTTITRYLSGRRIPSLSNIVMFADYFNCTVDYLIGKENENFQTTFKTCPPFSERFKFLFKYFDKTKAELLGNTDITESLIYVWLNGEYNPTIDNVIKLSEFFNCSVDFVLGRGD